MCYRSTPTSSFDAQLIASEILGESAQPFIVPTPGAPNEFPAAPSPILIGEQGVFFGTRTVELQLEDPNPSFEIRYTLDGTEPTPESSLYDGPLVLTESAMLQARTFDASAERTFDPSNATCGHVFCHRRSAAWSSFRRSACDP